jgi:acetate---CoA ligase (ADP-forming)
MVQAGVPAVAGLRTGLRCAAALLETEAAPGRSSDGARLREVAATARRGPAAAPPGRWLAEHEAKALLREAGIPVPDGGVVADAGAAVAARAAFGPEIVLKLSAASVQHKSDIGGVALGLAADEEVRVAYGPLAELALAHGGVVLAERMAAPDGIELIVAAHRDGVVPALVIGLGGIWTELLADVCVLPLPAEPGRIREALADLRGASLLFGGRGRPAVDVDALCALANSIGGLLVDRSLQLVECNPVLVGTGGAVALDASVRLGAEPGGAVAR